MSLLLKNFINKKNLIWFFGNGLIVHVADVFLFQSEQFLTKKDKMKFLLKLIATKEGIKKIIFNSSLDVTYCNLLLKSSQKYFFNDVNNNQLNFVFFYFYNLINFPLNFIKMKHFINNKINKLNENIIYYKNRNEIIKNSIKNKEIFNGFYFSFLSNGIDFFLERKLNKLIKNNNKKHIIYLINTLLTFPFDKAKLQMIIETSRIKKKYKNNLICISNIFKNNNSLKKMYNGLSIILSKYLISNNFTNYLNKKI